MAHVGADPRLDVEIVMPVHNEGESIEATLREWYEELSPRVRLGFSITEDGSVDDTKEVLARLRDTLPLKLDMSPARRGYSRAVIDAFRATRAPFVLAVDSDGQCDPRDFWQFWDRRNDFDVVIGWRVQRADSRVRKLMSRSYHGLHHLLFTVPIHDPSCPYLLIRRSVLDRLLPALGVLEQGFWWEFTARARRAGFTITELPVNHRNRAAGVTQVYRIRKIPGIAISHGLGLVRVWWQTRR
jgi:glycosyltransferase involved in cell wall biosynthesis